MPTCRLQEIIWQLFLISTNVCRINWLWKVIHLLSLDISWFRKRHAVENETEAEQKDELFSPPLASLAVDLKNPGLVLNFELTCYNTKLLPPCFLTLLFSKLAASRTFWRLLLPVYAPSTHISFHASLGRGRDAVKYPTGCYSDGMNILG